MARRRVGYWALHLVAALLHLQSTSLPSWLIIARPSGMEGGDLCLLCVPAQPEWGREDAASTAAVPMWSWGAAGPLCHSQCVVAPAVSQGASALSLLCCHEVAAGLEGFGSSLGVPCVVSTPALTAAERGAACAVLELQQQRWGFPKGERFALCSSSEERALAPAVPSRMWCLQGPAPLPAPRSSLVLPLLPQLAAGCLLPDPLLEKWLRSGAALPVSAALPDAVYK